MMVFVAGAAVTTIVS
jgi:hypothetical protein